MNFKEIHIGSLIHQRVAESQIKLPRICLFFQYSEEEIEHMYTQKDLSTDMLLRWSKLLKYDFFRLYTQHLILYSPPSAFDPVPRQTQLPLFRKSIYTKEVIDFILNQFLSKKMTKDEIIDRYKIPKTTLNKWLLKHTEQKK
ncbi:transposase [Chryseobacterium sp.]|uniref:transposase n=1 Tax=Chryseobacterium sp. TaxID=1871047 RepID=UPI0025B89556|nr:transposase [Chryseobacterium sp.]MBV8325161.1 transposase [Chryseobacterium sp.]